MLVLKDKNMKITSTFGYHIMDGDGKWHLEGKFVEIVGDDSWTHYLVEQ